MVKAKGGLNCVRGARGHYLINTIRKRSEDHNVAAGA